VLQELPYVQYRFSYTVRIIVVDGTPSRVAQIKYIERFPGDNFSNFPRNVVHSVRNGVLFLARRNVDYKRKTPNSSASKFQIHTVTFLRNVRYIRAYIRRIGTVVLKFSIFLLPRCSVITRNNICFVILF